MSSFPTPPRLQRAARQPHRRLPWRASLYLLLVAGLTAAIVTPVLEPLLEGEDVDGWWTFAALAVAAAASQLFAVRTPPNHSYHTSVLFLSAAALLLPPPLLVLVGIVQNVPEWLKERYAWYIQGFNICNYTLNALAAWAVNRAVLSVGDFLPSDGARFAIGGLAACATFVTLNHVLLAVMLRLARGRSFRETGLFAPRSISIDFVLTSLGVALAWFWLENMWLIPVVVAPLLVLHRSLTLPQLEEEARKDPKTGLYNARHFSTALADELARAARLEHPLSLLMIDLDLLRDVNNTYGHLAGDAVLTGVADVFRDEIRPYDVAARFGGEEFSILLPETRNDEAVEIAERIRRAIASRGFVVETADDAINVTVSIGVATYPIDARDAGELIHQADVAVYRAKLQGRNRVLSTSGDPLLTPPIRTAPRPVAVHERPASAPRRERTQGPRPQRSDAPAFASLPARLGLVVGGIGVGGIAAGVAAFMYGTASDLLGLLAVVALVAIGQALAIEVVDQGSISVSAVGALAGAAAIGPPAALAVAITICAVEWSARRTPPHTVLFNIGTLTLASLAAIAVFAPAGDSNVLIGALGPVAGAAYFAVNVGLLSLALASQDDERWWRVLRERFSWLLPHYVAYGFVGGVIALAYDAVGLYAFAVFALPLLLMRKTQEAYLAHTQRSAQRLRETAETIQEQNVSLERANALLRERSTAAMASLSATVDARDAYTAGHSRRVQQLTLAIARELGLSQAELDVLGQAALFHDIGKLAVPDSVLLKPATLTDEEWALMQRHADEGARIIERLGFLGDAVPAIRHHHERWDGTGYPDGLAGEEIPIGARIIHVADALDSMLTTRIYSAARPVEEALAELGRLAGSQFCPRTVAALERVLETEPLARLAVAAALPADANLSLRAAAG